MKSFKEWQYILCLHKTYFDTGYGITSIVKYLIGLLGFGNILVGGQFSTLVYAGFGYVIFCYIFGLMWYKWGFIWAQNEVGNRWNLFQKEVRETIKNGKVFKPKK